MQSNEPSVTTGGHPSKINLSSIPATQPVEAKPPDGPEPTVKGVLRALAVEFQAAMESEAESFIWACRQMDVKRIAPCHGKYEAYRDAYGLICKLWDSFEFDGPPQPKQVWHTLQGHANAIMQETGKDTAF